MTRPTKLNAIAQCKCPRCRRGKMFKTGLFSTQFMAMHEKCPNCGFRFEIEPSFFQGAMYVSYAFSVAMFVIVFALTTILLQKPDIQVYMTNIIVTVILFIPFSFRYSRAVFLHLFGGVKYENPQDSEV